MLSVLTDSKRVSVINPPAGSGKTGGDMEAARPWVAAGQSSGSPPRNPRNAQAAGDD